MKQAPGEAGDPVPAVLPRAIGQPPCLHFAEAAPVLPRATAQPPCLRFMDATHHPPLPSIFWRSQKNLSKVGISKGSCVKGGQHLKTSFIIKG